MGVGVCGARVWGVGVQSCARAQKTGDKYAVKIIEKKKFAMTHGARGGGGGGGGARPRRARRCAGTTRGNALMDEVNILRLL